MYSIWNLSLSSPSVEVLNIRQLLLKTSFDFQELTTRTELETVLVPCSPRPLVLNSNKGCIQDNTQNSPPNAFPHLEWFTSNHCCSKTSMKCSMTCRSIFLYRLSVILMGKFCSSGLLFTWLSGHIILLGLTAQAHYSTEPLHAFWALMLNKNSVWYDLFLYPHYCWFCTLLCVLPLWCFWPLDWFFYPSLVKNSLHSVYWSSFIMLTTYTTG